MQFLYETVATLWGYPLSVLELVGVLTGLTAVVFASKAWAVNFLFGVVNAVVYFMLYFEFRLYSMMLLQLVYLSFSIYGFYHWKHPDKAQEDQNNELKISFLTWKMRWMYVALIFILGAAWGWSVIHFQATFPDYFAPPAYPWLDAILTMASVVGQWLLSKKVWENWVIWLVVDAISTLLFFHMGMIFTALLYALFTLIAIKAMIDWKKIYEKSER